METWENWQWHYNIILSIFIMALILRRQTRRKEIEFKIFLGGALLLKPALISTVCICLTMEWFTETFLTRFLLKESHTRPESQRRLARKQQLCLLWGMTGAPLSMVCVASDIIFENIFHHPIFLPFITILKQNGHNISSIIYLVRCNDIGS